MTCLGISSNRWSISTFTLIFCIFYVAIILAAPINLQSISQPASLRYRGTTQGLETLSDGSRPRNIVQIELKTPSETFVLEISDSSTDVNSPITSPDYEEIIHDISKGTTSQPYLNVVQSGNEQDEVSSLRRCLYSGRIAGSPGSVVSLSTCNGHITGMIRTTDGQLLSIEPDFIPTAPADSKGGIAPQSVSYLQPLSALRILARQGDLKALATSIPTVRVVDALKEQKLEDELALSTQRLHWRANPLTAAEIDSDDDLSSYLPKENSNCGMNERIHHPPVATLRKMGLTSRDIHRFVRDHNLNEVVTQSAEGIGALSDSFDSEAARSDGPAYPNRFVEIVIYHDRARLQSYNTTRDKTQDEVIARAREDGIAVFNNIRAYYRESGFAHNVECVLKGHVFFPGGDPYTKYLARDGGTMVVSNYGLLENFNKYRSHYGHNNHDIGVLLSGNRFQSNIKGVANVGSLCGTSRYNGNINSVTYRNIVLNSVLTAHECGHVLAAQHDNGMGHIMYPYVTSDTSFSPASVRSIDNHLSRTRCTINNPTVSTALHPIDNSSGVLSSLSTALFGSSSTSKPVHSYIYSQNIQDTDQHDFVNNALINHSGTKQTAFAADVSDRALLLQARQRELIHQSKQLTQSAKANDVALDRVATSSTLPTSTTGLTTAQLLTAIALTSLGCCVATAGLIGTILWYFGRDKPLQDLLQNLKTTSTSKPDKAPIIDTVATPPSNNRGLQHPNVPDSRYTFTPRLRPNANGAIGNLTTTTTFDPNQPDTPRETSVPASPTYSESVRHRGASKVPDDEHNEDGIIFEDDSIEDLRGYANQ